MPAVDVLQLIPELIGIAAAGASLYAAYAKTIVPLRIAAVAANVLGITYSYMHGSYTSLALNMMLLPLNVWRLHAMIRLVAHIEEAIDGDLNLEWLLPYTRPKTFEAGDTMMRRGDKADAAFYITEGEVELVEIGKRLGKGTLLGEMGLFTPDGARTMSIRCVTDVKTAKLDYIQFRELYFQNPQFGFRLLQLVIARLHKTGEKPDDAADRAAPGLPEPQPSTA
jgi:hypothetical protein